MAHILEKMSGRGQWVVPGYSIKAGEIVDKLWSLKAGPIAVF